MYNIFDLIIEEYLDKAIALYGLEGTEEVINDVYKSMPMAKKIYLFALRKRLK